MPRGRPKKDQADSPSKPLPASRKRQVKKEEDDDFELKTEQDDIKPATKKKAPQKRKTPHENVVILLDVGSNSAQKDKDGISAVDHARKVADWVLSRAIFTESKDEYALVLFGSETSHLPVCDEDFSNIYFTNDDVATANIDMLKVLEKEVGTNMKTTGDYLNALIVAIEFLKVQCDGMDVKELTGKTIILLSNLSGVFGKADKDTINAIISGLRLMDIDLIVIGPDLSAKPDTQEQSEGVQAAREIVEKSSGSSYTFHDALNNLKFFTPKKVQARGQPFNLELGPDAIIPVQMYVKNSEFSTKMSFETVSKSTDENLRKIRQYRKIGDGTEDALDDEIDDEENGGAAAKPKPKVVEKQDIVKGYRYGSSLIAFSDFDIEQSAIVKEGKQLQLLSFTDKDNILPQHILSSCHYLLPAQNNDAAVVAMSALVKAMIDMNVVALCRYAYNVNSNPRLSALYPKISKKGLPVLQHVILPFYEDVRDFYFPPLNEVGEKVDNFELELIDAYINELLLAPTNDPDNPGPSKELLRPKNIKNPKHQYTCQILKQKAMHPDKPLDPTDHEALLEMLSPPPDMMKNIEGFIGDIQDRFKLEKIVKGSVFAAKTKAEPERDEMKDEVKNEPDSFTD